MMRIPITVDIVSLKDQLREKITAMARDSGGTTEVPEWVVTDVLLRVLALALEESNVEARDEVVRAMEGIMQRRNVPHTEHTLN